MRHDVGPDHRRCVQRRVADRPEQTDRHQTFGIIGFRIAHHHLGPRGVVDHPRARIVRIAHLVDQPVLFLPLEAVAAQARGAVVGQQVVGRIGVGEPRPLDAPRPLHFGHAVILEQVGVGLARHRGDHIEARPVVGAVGAQHHPPLGGGLAHLQFAARLPVDAAGILRHLEEERIGARRKRHLVIQIARRADHRHRLIGAPGERPPLERIAVVREIVAAQVGRQLQPGMGQYRDIRLDARDVGFREVAVVVVAQIVGARRAQKQGRYAE